VPSIDERIVAISFENAVFEQRVAQTMGTLTKLDTALKNMGSTSGFDKIEASASRVTLNAPMSALDKLKAKLSGAGAGASEGLGQIDQAGNRVTLSGPHRAIDLLKAKFGQLSAGTTFTDIERAADRTTLSGLSNALDNVTAKFSVLSGAAAVALGNIASQAAMKGGSFAKSFAFGPINDGLKEYQTNLGSIQTILSNTQGQQVTGLQNVNKYLGELNTYSDQTIYNFGEMAKNIGTFTAAGVALPEATQSIKGIANLAAASGSSSQQASTAMYQLSQAIASGRVSLQDWNSVVNAGMGGALFQKALMRTATNFGALEKGAVKIDKATGKATVNGKSFRESIMAKPGEQSWLTSEVLTKTLSQFTGDLSDAELAAQGFSAQEIKAIQDTAKTAKAAATEVKTLPQVFDVARETIGSGWAKTFQLVLGDFEDSKKTFTELSNFINGFINKVSDARNKILGEWAKLGGRNLAIEGIKTAFSNLFDILGTVRDAFRDIFPAQTGKSLFEMTKNFTDLMHTLTPSPALLDNLKRIFAGLFAVVHIGWTLIKALGGAFFDLLGVVGKGSGGFLGFIAGIGDFLVAVDKAITQGDTFKNVFKTLGGVLEGPVRLITKLAGAIVDLFKPSGEDAGNVVGQVDRLGQALTPAEKLVRNLKNAWNNLVDAFKQAKSALEPWFSSFVDKLSDIGRVIGDALSNLSFDQILSGVQTGLIAALVLMFKKAFDKGSGVMESLSGTLDSLSGVLKGFTGNLEAMQQKIKAEAILAIAGAVAVLAAGIFILSTIDGDKLSKAMTAVAVGLGELMGAMKLMTSGMGLAGVLQLPIIAAGLIGVAIAVTILAGALKIFATIKWEDLGKGMVGIAGGLTAIALGMALMPPTLPVTAAGLILIGVALNLIGLAIKTFASIKWEDIGKGLFVMVDALGGIALGVSLMPATLPLTAAGLILMGIALSAIGGALKTMGGMDVETIIKGLGAMMAAIAGIGLAVSLVPPTIGLTAAGLLIIGAAMTVIAGAIGILGSMKVETLVKGLAAMGGALLILAGGLTLMTGTLAGSAALLAASVALAILAPTLAFLGTLSWGTIIKGLVAIALAMGTLAAVGALAAEPLALLGLALLPLAAVFVVTAGAVFIFAKALALLGDKGSKGIAVMVTALTAFVAMIPTLVINFIKGLLGIVDQLAALAPKVLIALGIMIDTVIAFVIQSAPKLAIAIGVLVDSIIQVLVTNAPRIIAAGFKLLMDLLSGISNNIGQITTKVTEIINKFMSTLAAQAPSLVASGVKVLVAFLQGITNNIPKVVTTVANMVTKFIAALTSNVGKVVTAGQNLILRLIGAIASFVPRLVAKGTSIIISFLSGIEQAVPKIKDKALHVARVFLNNLADGIVKLADIIFKAFINLLNGLAESIRNNDDQLIDAGVNLGSAIGEGMIKGFSRMGALVRRALEKVFELLPGWAKKILGIKSPSTVFAEIGKNTMEGYAQGIIQSTPAVTMTLGQALRTLIDRGEDAKVIGSFLGKEFMDGLTGGIDNRSESRKRIDTAFQGLRDKLREQTTKLSDQIKEDRQKLKEELEQDHPSKQAIESISKDIRDNTALLRLSRQAASNLMNGLKDEKREMITLAASFDQVTANLDKAKQELERITQARDSFIESTRNQYNTLPDIASLMDSALAEAALTAEERVEARRKKQEEDTRRAQIDQVALYQKALRDKIAATQKYMETLEKLRALGLDDATYQRLVTEGVKDQDFADALLRGGKTAIDQVNELDRKLLETSTKLAQDASANLYQAGVNAAQGLVDGLKARQDAIQKQMDAIAEAMVKSIKRRLGIRSPSAVMSEIGDFAAKGVVQGLQMATPAVVSAAANIGDQAASAMADSLSQVSDVLSSEISSDITITPVLDLTQVRKDAASIGDLTSDAKITAGTSIRQASAVSQGVSAIRETTETAAATAGNTFNFEQNNYSPESLSNIEIYRQTNNQLAKLKSVVGFAV
jgi:tape measure domain-containing protein